MTSIHLNIEIKSMVDDLKPLEKKMREEILFENEEEIVEEDAGEETTEKEGKKYMAAALNVEEDADMIRSYDLIRKVAGMSNSDIFKLGITAAKETDTWKKAVEELKGSL